VALTSFLSNRGLHVKLAPKEDGIDIPIEERYESTRYKIEATQAYSEIIQDFVAGVTGTLVVGTVVVIGAKFASDFLKIGLSAVTKSK
jgi:hypothetical protein